MNLSAEAVGVYSRGSFWAQAAKHQRARDVEAATLKSSFLHLVLHPAAGGASAIVVLPAQAQTVVHVVDRWLHEYSF